MRFFVAVFLLLGACAHGEAEGPVYTVGYESGEHRFLSGSILGCITSESEEGNFAYCTMKLAHGDRRDMFPVRIKRGGKMFEVVQGKRDDAWTECEGHCIRSR